MVPVDTFFGGHPRAWARSISRPPSMAAPAMPGAGSTPTSSRSTAVHITNNEVLPTFDAHQARISTVLSDNGREFCGRPDRHPYELFL